jgi:hypothetical protein
MRNIVLSVGRLKQKNTTVSVTCAVILNAAVNSASLRSSRHSSVVYMT